MICKNCGEQLSEEVQVCNNCGADQVEPMEQTVEPTPETFQDEPIAKTIEATGEIPTPVSAPVITQEPAPKKSKKGLIIGIAVTLLAILLAIGIWLGGSLSADSGESTPGSSSSVQNPPSSTPPSSSAPTSQAPSHGIKVEIIPAELTYEMTEEDVTKFYDLLSQCKDLALSGKDADTVMKAYDELEAHFDYMDAQRNIANVLYYSDLTNEEASQLYLTCTDIVTEANDAYLEMAKELYKKNFKAKEQFFADWTEQDLKMLAHYTSEVMELQQRNSEILVEYQDLQNDSEMYTKMIPLYIETVQNNNRYAQIFGYKNYYEYAYEMSYDRDYGSEEVAKMRSFVSTYLTDALSGALKNFNNAQNSLSNVQRSNMNTFLTRSFTSNYKDEIENYLSTLPEQTCEDMLDMFNGNIIMVDRVPNAQAGAFTTAISKDRSLCFFGPGYSTALTLIHEVGHYYGSMHTALNDIPLDLAEVQSQGNEWLFMSYMENEMSEALHTAVVNYKLYNDLATIMISTIVDEFEERVYTHPDVASLTSDDFDAIMADVCESYGGISSLSSKITDMQNYWRLVVVEQPVYYISYGVSAIASINIYTIAEEDYDQAVVIYCNLIENVDLDEGFLGNLGNVGLDTPFDESVYQKLATYCS